MNLNRQPSAGRVRSCGSSSEMGRSADILRGLFVTLLLLALGSQADRYARSTGIAAQT